MPGTGEPMRYRDHFEAYIKKMWREFAKNRVGGAIEWKESR
jgi:hypothetical protein